METRKVRQVKPSTKMARLAKKWRTQKTKEAAAKAAAKEVEAEMEAILTEYPFLLNGRKMEVFAAGVKAGTATTTVVKYDAEKYDANTLMQLYPTAYEQKVKAGIIKGLCASPQTKDILAKHGVSTEKRTVYKFAKDGKWE